MSDTTTQETTEAQTLPANLVKIASGELHDRAEALAAEADALLDSDDWDAYKEVAENERKLRAEIERRGEAARKATPVEPAKVPVAAQERIEQTRQALAEADASMETLTGVKRRRDGAPPEWGETVEEADEPAREKADAFMNAAKLRADLAAMEARLPFLDQTDEQVATDLEDTAIEMEDLRLSLKTSTAEGRRAAAAKAERQLAEVTERHYSVMGENEVRKGERTKEALLDQLAERKAFAFRAQALADWTRRKQELEELLQREVREGESAHFDMAPLREATQAVDAYTKAIETGQPLAAHEIARQRAALEATAPHVRGSFHDLTEKNRDD